MKRVVGCCVVVLVVSVVGAQGVMKRATVETMPPVVVKTVPQAGDVAVDPDLKEISVTFSKDMKTRKMWAWVQISKDTFPQITGDIRYLEDKRTCVAPVKLEPGKTYVIWFNQGKFNSFRDEGNRPAVPYQLVFQTKVKYD
jgi:RNA polymerase sigma-70 factor (ECF subfamily)